jgi:hypothetical protein
MTLQTVNLSGTAVSAGITDGSLASTQPDSPYDDERTNA